MEDCQALTCITAISLTKGMVKGITKTKGMSAGMRVLYIVNESLKSFNENKGPKFLVACTTKKKCLCYAPLE